MVGSTWVFNYYSYKREYGCDPLDFEDFFDGLNSLGAKNKIEYLANGGK